MTPCENLLIVANEGNALAELEKKTFGHGFPSVDIVTTVDFRAAHRQGALSYMSRMFTKRRCIGRIIKKAGPTTSVILTYGNDELCETAAAAASKLGIKSISRSALDVRPSIPSLSPTRRHKVADHALTFVSSTEPELTCRMMVAMAKARTGSDIRWCPILDTDIEFGETPDNLHILPAIEITSALSGGTVDWYVDFSDGDFNNTSTALLLQALSAGIPFAAIESEVIAEPVMHDCGITFGPAPTKEEFIRGMLPYIDSDFRSETMSEAARQCWDELYNPTINAPQLIKSISLISEL